MSDILGGMSSGGESPYLKWKTGDMSSTMAIRQ